MILREKIRKAINNIPHDSTPYRDDYDGFTQYDYDGLIIDVECALEEDGHGESVSQNVVNEYVFQMIN